jgi:small conductance mechanosensitive channel
MPENLTTVPAQFFTGSGAWILANAINLLVALVVLVAGWWLANTLARQATTLLPRTRRVDRTLTPLVAQIVRYGILLVTLIVVLAQFGVQTASILAVLGAAGLAVALALQGTLSNLAAGIVLVMLRPFSVGESIDLEAGYGGEVIEVGLFATQIKTYDGVYMFVPNSKIWGGRITNWSREPRRMVEHKFAIEPTADIAKVREAMIDVALKDGRVLRDPAPTLHVDAIVPGAVNVVWRSWTANANWWAVRIELIEKAKVALDGLDYAADRDIVDVRITNDGYARREPPPA